jgi:hypothetical protein
VFDVDGFLFFAFGGKRGRPAPFCVQNLGAVLMVKIMPCSMILMYFYA